MGKIMKDLHIEEPGFDTDFQLEEHIGFRLRLAAQRHVEIFARRLPEVTPPQFAVMVKLSEQGPVSQNYLGRLVGLDAATAKGVVDRLEGKGFVSRARSPRDQRKIDVSLTEEGASFVCRAIPDAQAVARETMTRLPDRERERLLALLAKL